MSGAVRVWQSEKTASMVETLVPLSRAARPRHPLLRRIPRQLLRQGPCRPPRRTPPFHHLQSRLRSGALRHRARAHLSSIRLPEAARASAGRTTTAANVMLSLWTRRSTAGANSDVVTAWLALRTDWITWLESCTFLQVKDDSSMRARTVNP